MARHTLPAAMTLFLLFGCTEPREVASPGCTPSEPSSAAVHWRDNQGRAVIYRGVNVAGPAKRTPDLMPPVDATDYERIAAWGMTAIRLLVFWQGIEPEPGIYDAVYLAGVRHQIETAAAAGLDVILDLHQDVYGAGFDHTGFPRWSCDEALYATYESPSSWFLGYFEPEVMTCFDRFWTSAPLRAAYAAAVVELVERVGQHPAVVGVEIINEPYWGSYSNSRFEADRLQPFYDEVALALAAASPRVADGSLRIVAEPAVSFGFGLPTSVGWPWGCPTWAFAPHYYPLHTETGDYDGGIDGLRQTLSGMASVAAGLGAPLVFTELGTVSGTGSVAYLADVLSVSDALWASAFIWDYGPGTGFALVDIDGSPRAEATAVARPYAHRVAGEPVTQAWEPTSATLEVTWRETGIEGETILVLPTDSFPGDVEVTSSDATGRWSWRRAGTRLLVTADPGAAEHVVTVRPH